MSDDSVVNFRGIKLLGIPYCRSHWFRLCKAEKAPQFFKLGPFRNSPPMWWRKEIIDWLKAKAKQPTAP